MKRSNNKMPITTPASGYKDGTRIHVYITRDMDQKIKNHKAEDEPKTVFIKKCIDFYCEYLDHSGPVTRDDMEYILTKYGIAK